MTAKRTSRGKADSAETAGVEPGPDPILVETAPADEAEGLAPGDLPEPSLAEAVETADPVETEDPVDAADLAGEADPTGDADAEAAPALEADAQEGPAEGDAAEARPLDAAEDAAPPEDEVAASDDAVSDAASEDGADDGADEGAEAGEPIRLHRRARHDETEELLAWLLAAPAGAPLTIDASEVDNISTPYVLAIVAAARARADAGSPAVVTNPSPAFVDAFSDLGLFGDLMKMEIRA